MADIKARPILMSAPMVRACLNDTKTQTRRVVKFPRSTGAYVMVQGFWKGQPDDWWPFVSADGETLDNGNGLEQPMTCPYGYPGDRLWVRETFRSVYENDTGYCGVKYAADFGSMEIIGEVSPIVFPTDHWNPSIHMPKWASRITLEITDVRVERLQDISEEDAEAEGVNEECDCSVGWRMDRGPDPVECDKPFCGDGAVEQYHRLWDSINGEGAWDKNEWVWAISFKRVGL